jgi:hypothetical protein
MAKKSKNLSLEEEVTAQGAEIVKGRLDIKDFSHLVETLILKEYIKFKKSEEKQDV